MRFQQENSTIIQTPEKAISQFCKRKYFQLFQEEFSETCDLRDPDEISPQERTQKRCKLEAERFDPDYYM